MKTFFFLLPEYNCQVRPRYVKMMIQVRDKVRNEAVLKYPIVTNMGHIIYYKYVMYYIRLELV